MKKKLHETRYPFGSASHIGTVTVAVIMPERLTPTHLNSLYVSVWLTPSNVSFANACVTLCGRVRSNNAHMRREKR